MVAAALLVTAEACTLRARGDRPALLAAHARPRTSLAANSDTILPSPTTSGDGLEVDHGHSVRIPIILRDTLATDLSASALTTSGTMPKAVAISACSVGCANTMCALFKKIHQI